MKILAVEDKIVVELLQKSNITKGGIHIPETAQSQEPQLYGKVISTGPKVEQIEDGDTIMFHERGGMDVIIDKQIFRVLGSSEIYAIIKDEDESEEFKKLEPIKIEIENQREVKPKLN